MNNLILVNEEDQQIGTAEKLVVHQEGLLHRAFSIFVFRKNAANLELLLQKRERNKYHSGGLWSNTCCGHPEDQEDLILAGQRRITEELGIKVNLRSLGKFIYHHKFSNGLLEHELDNVLIGKYQDDLIVPNPNEVEETKWIQINQFETWLASTEDRYTTFTAWLIPAWEIIKTNFTQIELLFD